MPDEQEWTYAPHLTQVDADECVQIAEAIGGRIMMTPQRDMIDRRVWFSYYTSPGYEVHASTGNKHYGCVSKDVAARNALVDLALQVEAFDNIEGLVKIPTRPNLAGDEPEVAP